MGLEAGTRSTYSHRSKTTKRAKGGASCASSTCGALQKLVLGLCSLCCGCQMYRTNVPEEKERLASVLWKGADAWRASGLSDANPELVQLLMAQVDDGDDLGTQRWRKLKFGAAWPRFEGTLTVLMRSRSIFNVPLVVAAISVRFWHFKVPAPVWQIISTVYRGVMSRNWVRDFLEVAAKCDPGVPYEVPDGIVGAAFDNYQCKSGYSRYATQDSAGEPLYMTNWASLAIPAIAVPPQFKFESILGV